MLPNDASSSCSTGAIRRSRASSIPGPNQVPIDNADLDVATWTLRLEAQMPTSGGTKAPFVATGQLTNLGSWTTRTYSGTYVFGAETGRFTVTLN